MNRKEFIDYCWSFYGPTGLYCDTFARAITSREMDAACTLVWYRDDFAGDSFDREKVREVLLFVRNTEELNRRAIG